MTKPLEDYFNSQSLNTLKNLTVNLVYKSKSNDKRVKKILNGEEEVKETMPETIAEEKKSEGEKEVWANVFTELTSRFDNQNGDAKPKGLRVRNNYSLSDFDKGETPDFGNVKRNFKENIR